MSIRQHISDIKTFGFGLWWYQLWKHTWINCVWQGHIRPTFWPQHPELRAAVPRTWADLDSCIEEFLYAAVISYVEGEDGLKVWDAQNPEHEAKKRAPELREVYEWAKTGRKAFQERVDAALPSWKGFECWEQDTRPYDQIYGEYDRLEHEFNALDDKYLTWIVTWRRMMWT